MDYIRLEIEKLGSFFTKIDDVLKNFLNDYSDDDEYDEALQLNNLTSDLESKIPFNHEIEELNKKYKNRIKYAFKPNFIENNNFLIEEIEDSLKYLGYTLDIVRVSNDTIDILYEDNVQIAYIRKI